jgi:hypothetical protein
MNDDLARLLSRSKCGVHLSMKDPRDVYQSVAGYLADVRACSCSPDESLADKDVIAQIVAKRWATL